MKKLIVAIMIVVMTVGMAVAEPYKSDMTADQTWIDSNTEQRLELVRDANAKLYKMVLMQAKLLQMHEQHLAEHCEIIDALLNAGKPKTRTYADNGE